ncbi:MAG: hypothetical protein MUW57_23695 [Pseudomonas sp.]|nr:hypothetical protein [Pseudomonas sp.]
MFLLFDNFNDLSALEKLESLNQNSKNDEQINTSTLWLSTIYRNLNDHKKTRKILETSIKMVNDDTIKTQIIIRLSTTINLLDGQDASIAMLEDRLQEVVSDTQKASIYEAIAEIFKENGKGTDQAIALEKAVEYSPGNKKLLFDAAYIQSNENLDIACIQNYLTLLSLEPGHPIALNNLGVSAGKHKIKGKQIELFNKSITNGSTLAMANLANIYIESGLYEEAAKILSEARNSENIHENIGTSFYTLKTQSSKDQEDWSALVKSSALLQRRIRAYGEAYFDNNFSVVNWAGDWSNSDKLKITLILESDTLSAEWDSLESAYATQSTFRYRLSGNVKNRSARLTLSKKQSPANPTSILGMANDYNFPCMAYISTDDKTLHIFSKNEKSITEFELFRL